LRALKLRMIRPRRPAYRASAIPLRNAAAGRGAQDDDAKHDPSPGDPRQDKGGRRIVYAPVQERVTPGGPPASEREDVAGYYLRAAHAYILISMPTGTSTILGVFQAILALLATGRLPPSLLSYSVLKSSPMKSFVMNLPHVPLLQRKKSFRVGLAWASNRNAINHFTLIYRRPEP